jgi:zinc protease
MTTAVHRGLSPLRRTLSNGGIVIAQHTTTHRAVTIHVSVAAGSGHDPDDALGTAHFVAKVIDRGTTSRSTDALAEAFDGRGVSLSVGVSRHLMTFTCTCLADDVEDVLQLVADVLVAPTFPPDQVELRRSSIVTSIRQDEDNPAVVATDALMAALYPNGHPYGRRAKGTVASVQAIGREALIDFHRAHVGASSLRVVIVGDVEAETAVRMADAAFGAWTHPGGAPLLPPPAAAAGARTIETIAMPGKVQSDIAYGFISVTRSDPRYYPLTLMNTVLGQYAMGGRLGDSIRERQGMAYYVFSGFDANVAEGPLMVRAGVSPSNVARALASIDEELTRMAHDGVTPAELADAKRYLIGSMPRVLETNGGIAGFLHSAELFGLGLDFDQRLPGLLDAVTLDAVHDVARTFLRPDRAAIVVAGPPVARSDAGGGEPLR